MLAVWNVCRVLNIVNPHVRSLFAVGRIPLQSTVLVNFDSTIATTPRGPSMMISATHTTTKLKVEAPGKK